MADAQKEAGLAEAAAAYARISPGWDARARQLYAKNIRTWDLNDWIENERLGPASPSNDDPDRRVVPLKSKIFGNGRAAPLSAYCPAPRGSGREILVSEARANIMTIVERTHGTIELVPGTLIFHSNEYFGADAVVAEPFGGPMTMPFLKHYGDSQATVSRRIFCNLAMTPTLLVAGNFAASVSIYVVTQPIRLFKMPQVLIDGRLVFLKDRLGFSEASTFKNYTSVRNFDGMYMITAVDETRLVNTEAELRTMRGGMACFPEVALFHGHTKLAKIGQVDLLQNLPGGVTLGAYRNEVMRIGREAFNRRTEELAANPEPREPKPKQQATGAMLGKLWGDMPGLYTDALTALVNATLLQIRPLWGTELVTNAAFGLSPGTQQGYWRVRDHRAILTNKTYLANYPRNRTPHTMPMVVPANPPLTADQEQQLRELEEQRAANAAALQEAAENAAYQLIPPDPAMLDPVPGAVNLVQPVAQPVAQPVGAPIASILPPGYVQQLAQLREGEFNAQLLTLPLPPVLGRPLQSDLEHLLAAAIMISRVPNQTPEITALRRRNAETALLYQVRINDAIGIARAAGQPVADLERSMYAAQLIYGIESVHAGGQRHVTPRMRSRRRTPRHSR